MSSALISTAWCAPVIEVKVAKAKIEAMMQGTSASPSNSSLR